MTHHVYGATVLRGTTDHSFERPSSKTDWNVATGITDNDISDSTRGNYHRALQGVLTNAFDLTCKNEGSSVARGPQTTFGPSKRPCVVALQLCKKRTAVSGFFVIFLSPTLQWPQPLIPHYCCYEKEGWVFSIDGVAPRHWTRHTRARIQVRDFLISRLVQTVSGGPPKLQFDEYGGLSPGDKTAGVWSMSSKMKLNPVNPELNPICYLLALLGAHHFLHVSRIRVKLLTFRLLMSHIYRAPILDVSRSHTTTQHSR